MKVINVFKNGNRIQGYEVVDNNGNTAKVTKQQLIQYIEAGNVENATLQNYMGSQIVRLKKDKTKTASTSSQPSKNVQTTCNKIAILHGKEAINALINMSIGTPVKVKVTEYNGFEQTIYCGMREIQSRKAFIFFNGGGVDGTFALSLRFIENNDNIQIKLNDNEPSAVVMLSQMASLR